MRFRGQLEVRAPGHPPAVRRLLLEESAAQTVRIELSPPPAAADDLPTSGPPVGAWIAGGTALALGASGLSTFALSYAVVPESKDALQGMALGMGLLGLGALGVAMTMWGADSAGAERGASQPAAAGAEVVLQARLGGAALAGRF